jgi:hypothetical protein
MGQIIYIPVGRMECLAAEVAGAFLKTGHNKQ